MRLARERGSEPLREFAERSRNWSLKSVPMFVGIVPVKWLVFEIKAKKVWKGEEI